ncbi:MAG: LTA synthase family protein [Candidatus Cohnella colombiensis]|uniref:LTA synthase family protein n=1 Tax=Candidatus Cohnella colombiensis TaxID=3121368 RepID=A0AA95J9E6_9BACL|nr:MAG: LTA synthase family protein [Cohnella sp.]
MINRLKTALLHSLMWVWRGIGFWPYWGFMLLIVSLLYKLDWLDRQFNVGGMNQWKWSVNLGALLLICFWTILLNRRARAYSLLLLDILLTFIIFADLIYFRSFKDFISVPVLLQAGQVGELKASIKDLIHIEDLWLIADLPFAFIIVGWIFWRSYMQKRNAKLIQHATHLSITDNRKPRRFWIRFVPATIAFALGWALIFFPVEQQKNGWASGLFVGNWWNVPIYNVTGLFGFHGYDAYRYAKENWFNTKLSDEQKQEVYHWFADRHQLQQQMESEPLFGQYQGYNVLVIQAEAFQQFVIGQQIDGVEITPHINELIGKSIYFPNFYHQTGQGRTSDADFLTSCSMYPLPTGSVFIRFATNSFDCAPSILNEQGYDTTVHHAYDGSFWNRYNMYNNMDYNQFYSLENYTIDDPLGWSLSDESFFRQTMNQLKLRDRSPFYALAITISGHHPFKLTESKKDLNVGAFEGTTFGNYLQAMHYVDSAVGTLITRLKNDDLWDNTIVMFYGDHDNSLFDWDAYEQFFGSPLTDLDKDKIMRQVPYFIHLPQDANAGIVEKAVGQIDTTPTMMHLLGIPIDDRILMGVSMLSDAPKSVVFRNGGYTDGQLYYVPSADGIISNGTCYQLTDGGQATDSSSCAAGAVEAMRDLSVSDRVIEYDLITEMRKK